MQRQFELRQTVRHIGLGVTLTIVGLVEPQFGGRALLDWDGTGELMFWATPDEIEAVNEPAAHAAGFNRAKEALAA